MFPITCVICVLRISSATLKDMQPWEREELKKQYASIAEQMLRHHDGCGVCASDAMGRGAMTCAMLGELLSKADKIRELLGVPS